MALGLGVMTQPSVAASSASETRAEKLAAKQEKKAAKRAAKLAKKAAKTASPNIAGAAAPAPSTTFAAPGLADKGYPSGRGWSAVEADFEDLRGRVDAVKSDTETILVDVGDVKVDTETILFELEGIDANLVKALRYLTKIDEDIATLGEDVAAVKEGVDLLNSTLKLQVSISTRDATETGAQAVWAFVQVSQNGEPVLDLEAGEFRFASSFGPNGYIPSDEVFYCGDACFRQGAAGLYVIALQPDIGWEAGDYAGTIAVSIDGNVVGTSLIDFKIPMAPTPSP
jgi:hypothetical protein